MIYEKNELLWGQQVQENLFNKHIAVFGLGGVGSFAAEALARAGIGTLTLIDFDTISENNINRQLLALNSTIGKKKVFLMQERILDINSQIRVNPIDDFCRFELVEEILSSQQIDFVVDAIDTMKSKTELLEACHKSGISVVSSLGAGNRLLPEELYICDISKADPKKCAFAENIIRKLAQKGINNGISVVLSREKPIRVEKIISNYEIKPKTGEKIEFRKISPGSSPFVPPVAGYIMAGHVVRALLN